MEAHERIKIMCNTTDGFKIAEKDLELRGPGDIAGTRQSGSMNFKLASIVLDRSWLELAGNLAKRLIEEDPELSSAENLILKQHLLSQHGTTQWSKIS